MTRPTYCAGIWHPPLRRPVFGSVGGRLTVVSDRPLFAHLAFAEGTNTITYIWGSAADDTLQTAVQNVRIDLQ